MNTRILLPSACRWVAALALLALPAASLAQSDRVQIAKAYNNIKWTNGPATGDLGNATIKVPEGYRFCGSGYTKAFLNYYGNLHDGEVGVLEPIAKGDEAPPFFVLFRFDDTGYVKDDEKEDLTDEFADDLLKQFKEGTERSNAERMKLGGGPIHVTGWSQKPFYDSQTNNLTWAVIVSDDAGASANYESKVLGRKGVMSVNMVLDEKKVAATVPEYRKLISGFSYKSGDTYAEFRQGDKVAEYGLIGLASGGIAIAAVKWWKPLMKFGIFIVAGIGVALKKVFGIFKSRPANA